MPGERRKAAILATCCLSSLITGMDLTIANLAIPSVRGDLAATAAHTQWVIAIYALVVASLQLLGGAAGDRFGRRRVLQIGTAIFMFGSLLCSLAPIIDMLIAARAVQAVMIAAMSAMLAFLTPMAPRWLLMMIFVAFGITFGMVTVPINYAAVSGMPQDRAGAAAGITSTSKQIGICVGVALSGVLAAGALSPPMGDFTDSADPLWVFTFAVGLAIAALGIASTSPRAERSVERLAPLISPATPSGH